MATERLARKATISALQPKGFEVHQLTDFVLLTDRYERQARTGASCQRGDVEADAFMIGQT
eukprot:m.169326 g.169326  ORF g.169326 m.169326 type:complete len:61 (-) comp53221_c0_seq1:8-190(-)